jgi:hypothetical protein
MRTARKAWFGPGMPDMAGAGLLQSGRGLWLHSGLRFSSIAVGIVGGLRGKRRAL